MIRSSLERFSRGRIFTRTLRTPRGPRKVSVSPEASLRYWLPTSLNADRALIDASSQFLSEGTTVWDIGANIGVFSWCAAAVVGRTGSVLSVDADPFLTALLSQTSGRLLPEDANVSVLTAAVSDTIATAELIIPVRSRASNHLSDSTAGTQTGGKRHSVHVVSVTLDFLLQNTFSPKFVKMDIEGMELRALRSSPNLLKHVRPIFHLEVPAESAEEISDLMTSHEYELFDYESDRLLRMPLKTATWCTIARPK